MNWWALMAPDAAVGSPAATDLLIYGNIGDGWWSDGPSLTALALVEQIQSLGANPINVRVNSIGGSVMDGIAIYNALKNHAAGVTVTVDGFAVSIASLIAMAGSSVRMYANSMLMIHAPWGLTSGNSAQLRADADALDAQASAMATSYAAKSSDAKGALALLSDGIDHWYTAAEAKAAGFCDLILDDPSAVPIDPEESGEADPLTQMAATLVGRAGFDLSRFKTIPAAAAALQQEHTMKFRNQAMKYRAPAGGDGAAAGSPAAPAAAAISPTAALRERNAGIGQTFAAFRARPGISEIERECLSDPDVTVAQAQARLLAKLGDGAEPAAAAGIVIGGMDARDKFKVGALAALAGKSGISARVDNGNEFRGLSLIELARASLRIAGRNPDRMDKMEAVGAAFTYTGSDFPLLLANIAEKALLKGYTEAPETFQAWTSVGNLPDFKQASRVDLTQFPSLETVPDGGEYKMVQGVGDRGQYIQLATYGKLFSITRRAVIDDDLNAMTRVPQYMGRAAKRTVGNLVYAILTGNPNLRDGSPLFADRSGSGLTNNIMTAAGIISATVDAMRVAMATQKENGATLNIPLKKLIVPVALGGQARTVRDSQYQVDAITSAKGSQNTIPNPVRDIFDVVEDARLDAFDPQCWFGAADPQMTDTIEVAYLDGNPDPFMDQQAGWTVDGTQFKVRLDAGVSALDFRTLFKNAGH